MCGIGGIVRVWPVSQRDRALATPPTEVIPEAWLDLLDECIQHRGPDGCGRFRDRAIRADGTVVDIALVHRRLSILDHAGGHQPMLSLGKGQGATPQHVVALGCQLGLYRRDAREELRGVDSDPAEPNPFPLPPGGGSDADARSPHTPSSPGGGLQGGAAPMRSHSPHHPDSRGIELIGNDRARDRVSVVFNGCIYNHRELRRELQAAGHVFGTDHSDTEVLIHGWREWGRHLPEKLEGMFALAIWDHAAGTVFLTRDAFGEKPLELLGMRVMIGDDERDAGVLIERAPASAREPTASQFFAFASTAAALERLDAQMKIVDHAYTNTEEARREALVSLLETGYDAWPLSRAWPLSAGQSELIASGPIDQAYRKTGSGTETRTSFFSSPALRGKPLVFGAGGTDRTRLTPERVDTLLQAAVEQRLEADVPLGCFLSGGVDSSLIACHAKRARPDLRTFCVRMPDERYDESRFAAEVARHLGTNHATLDCHAEPAQDLVRLIEQLGEPFGDSSLLPTYWVSKAARERVRVALTGDGGDELFAGYERHIASVLIERFRGPLAMLPARMFSSPDPRSTRTRVQRLILAARGSPLESIFAWTDARALLQKNAAVPDPTRNLPGPIAGALADWVFSMFRSRRTILARSLTSGLRHLESDLLHKVDAGAMAAQLETRAPFLDSHLVNAVLSSDPLDLIPGGQRKGLLRQVARRYLPVEIIDRPKQGFAIPVGEWFRTDFGGMRTLLLDHLHSTEPFGPPSLGIELNKTMVRRMLDEHLGTGPRGRTGRPVRDHSQRLYMLLVLSIWAKWVGTVRAPAEL